MSRSRQENERLDRLASESRGGGGLPLPLLFSALLEEILDNGPTLTGQLVDITSHVLAGKTQKLAETWGGSWRRLTADALDQLASRGLVVEDDGYWSIGPKFVSGKRLTVIPKRERLNAADHVTVREKADREAREQESRWRHRANEIIQHPDSIQRDVVRSLRESAGEVGPIYPVLTDARGNLIDGRHRKEADPRWPVWPLDGKDGRPLVETEAQALAVMRAVDIHHRSLPKDIKSEIDDLVAQGKTINEAKRELVTTVLIKDASQSNVEIAEVTGVVHSFVSKVRKSLVSEKTVHAYVFKGGGRGDRTGEHAADCWCGKGTAEPRKPKPSAENAAKRERVTAVLLEDANQPNLDVCIRAGITAPDIVADERKRLESEQHIHTYVYGPKGIGHSTECWCGEGDTVARGKSKSPSSAKMQPVQEEVVGPRPSSDQAQICPACNGSGKIST